MMDLTDKQKEKTAKEYADMQKPAPGRNPVNGSLERISRIEDQIIDLHKGIELKLKNSVYDAIQIGELLTKQKKAIGHGGFQKWAKDSLPFSERTVRNYLRLYEERERIEPLIEQQGIGVKEALRLLAESDQTKPDPANPRLLFERFRLKGKEALSRDERKLVREFLTKNLDSLREKQKKIKGFLENL